MKIAGLAAASLHAGFTVYVVISLFFGSTGHAAYSEMELAKAKFQSNIEYLQEIRGALLRRMDSLLHDPSEIALRARALGYLRPGEVRIHVPVTGTERRGLTVGRVATIPGGFGVQESVIRAIAVGSALSVLSILLLFGRARRDK